ncbi:MAG: hypothetical protein Q8R82_04795 [Hyphomonadaceae bacterium]|nr:hypothetical protein [Hyphomonadaceae bacterium]
MSGAADSQFFVKESFCVSRRGADQLCQDIIVDNSSYLGVIDASAPGGAPSVDGQRPAALVAGVVSNCFSTLDPAMTAGEFVREVTRTIEGLKLNRKMLPFPSTGAAMFAVLHKKRREVWRVGNPWVIFDDEVVAGQLPAFTRAASFRAVYVQALAAKGFSRHELTGGVHDVEFQQMLDDTLGQLANNYGTFGFGALNGIDIPPPFVEVFSVDAGVKTITLATDGYPFPPRELQSSELELESALLDDPMMVSRFETVHGRGKGWTSFDDRAFIQIQSG